MTCITYGLVNFLGEDMFPDMFVIVYIYDVLVYSRSFAEHITHARQTLSDLLECGSWLIAEN